jgi:hypothetical protein
MKENNQDRKPDGRFAEGNKIASKLSEEWLSCAEEVINQDINAIILTDEELVFEINDRVDKKYRINQRTFERWKKKNKDEEELDKEFDEIGIRFVVAIKKALIKQKKNLFDKFRAEPNQWQRWAWIIERKFDDWNIKHRTDITSGGKPIQGNKIEFQEFNDTESK